VTVSMRVMSAGRGYDYLLKSVVRGDRSMGAATPLTKYYTEEGTPPGRWLGSGLHALGNDEIRRGDEVTPQQLALPTRNRSGSSDWRTAGSGVPRVRRGERSGGGPGSQSPA
jgi:hypothetical protein